MVANFGSVSLTALACLAGSALFLPEWTTVRAQDGWSYYQQPEPYYYPSEMHRRPDWRPRPALRQPAKPAKPTNHTASKQKETPPPAGPHLLVVSVKSQRVALYSNGKLVKEAPVSTGMPTHPTPNGIFSVIQKNRHHRSNIYSGAPMPYMQRLTWSGIALHQGALPGRPASHGCIRLPEQFANFLWRTTKLGTRVVVSREDTAPYDVAHAKLFQPKVVPTTVETMPPLRRTLDATTPALVRTAGMTTVETDALADRAADGEAQSSDTESSLASDTTASKAEPAKAQQEVLASLPLEKADIPDAILDSFAQSMQAKQKMTPPRGPISIFISRKEKQLFVRQGFVPLFTAPVGVRDENANFGTHVLTAYSKGDDSKDLRWMAVTLPPELPRAGKLNSSLQIDASVRMETATKHTRPLAKESAPHSIASVLDQIDIPQDVIDRVSEYITAGASLIISDHGLGNETGLHTDFIVVTR